MLRAPEDQATLGDRRRSHAKFAHRVLPDQAVLRAVLDYEAVSVLAEAEDLVAVSPRGGKIGRAETMIGDSRVIFRFLMMAGPTPSGVRLRVAAKVREGVQFVPLHRRA